MGKNKIVLTGLLVVFLVFFSSDITQAGTLIGKNISTDGIITADYVNGNAITGGQLEATALRFKDGTTQSTAAVNLRGSASVATNISYASALKIGQSETLIKTHYSKLQYFDFSTVGRLSGCQEADVMLLGAAPGDMLIASPKAVEAGGVETKPLTWNAWVTAQNSVRLRLCSPTTVLDGSGDPAGQLWRFDLWKNY